MTDYEDDVQNLSALLGGPIKPETQEVRGDDHSSLRRTSLAALQLQYLAENQPKVLAKTLSQIYTGQQGQAAILSSDEDESEAEDSPLGRLSFLSGGRDTRMSYAPSTAASGFDIEDEPPVSAMDLRRSASGRSRSGSEGQRQLQKAAKLARFFGTTKGEVLTQVLEDLEQEIEDDQDSTLNERLSVLEGVRRLRTSIVAS